MKFSEFRFANTKRCRESFHPINDWSMTDWACALGGEAGELQDIVLQSALLGDRKNLADIGREIADVVAYLDLLCVRLGIDLEAAAIAALKMKIETLQVKDTDGLLASPTTLTFEGFQDANTTLRPSWFSSDGAASRIVTAALAFGASVGLLLNNIKKLRRGGKGDRIELTTVAMGAAVILLALDDLCAVLDIDMEASVVLKFNEVSDRVGSSVKLGEVNG